MTDSKRLHLPNLSITGFRGIDDLSISRLGRVTLLAGKNSIGKTTVLDAVRVYAARGRYTELGGLLHRLEEVLVDNDEYGNGSINPDWTALFYRRNESVGACISIGPESVDGQLTLEKTLLTDEQSSYLGQLPPGELPDDHVYTLKILFRGNEHYIPWIVPQNPLVSRVVGRRLRNAIAHSSVGSLSGEVELPSPVKCESLGPGVMPNEDIARFWSNVALTDGEEDAVRALRLIFGSGIERVAVVPRVGSGIANRVLVKLGGHDRPVPLRSLGDGATRLFGVALALANSIDGFLLIDEAENGIHYSVHSDYWRMVLRSAQENNVQVLATTHSSDCIRGFAQAAIECEETEGVLVRLSRQYGNLRAVEYPDKELAIAAEQGIEVR